MIVNLVFFGAVLTGVLGNDVAAGSRQGNLNSYYLYTRAYDNARSPLKLPESENFLNPAYDTIVIVHGHNGDASSSLNPLVKDEFFNEDVNSDVQLNVIVLDWSKYTKLSYSIASAAVPSVGQALGDYLQQLAKADPIAQITAKITLKSLHLIGFDLGAHVVGFAGRALNGEAARITGLDPAGNGWGSKTPRLSKSDASYVEVIHTDGDGILSNGIGTAIGHVDFFVNGGGNQPGCFSHTCCHNRAWQLFADTLIRKEPLKGRLCSSNLQLTLNRCQGREVTVGGDALWKRHELDNSVYRVNTRRNAPY